ncbi:MAG: tRNA pseudouridine synthase B [Anaerolineales bacterium]|nr:tRNA pseudouridine synthase B [Anaerolineales bacterium]
MQSVCVACRFKGETPPEAAEVLRQLQPQKPPLSGIFNIDKPAGVTSHDVVQAIRRASGERRVGHAGTLDPMATGVLLVCVGKATRVTEYLMEHAKSYRAEITLGVSTDTLDAEGEVTHRADTVDVSRGEAEAALGTFVGQIEQIPPMYSAVRKAGKRLYELAREGVTVEREPRAVETTRLEVVEWNPPHVTVEIDCSKGTYVRAVARDLGELLGVGAHLSGLIRTASGRFTVGEANELETVVEALVDDWWMLLIHPLDEALLDYEAMIVDAATAQKICHGQRIEAPAPVDAPYARAYSEDGRFIALMRYEEWAQKWQPNKVFAEAS